MMGILFAFLCAGSVLGAIAASLRAEPIGIILSLIMICVWGRLAYTAFTEESLK